ncbi:MAG: glycosyltransferase [Verrucomicrobia bacterium]|jgi:glycosyltransferase involved in cell wall biosynthesis|nr:glycosyltransferase [Verrucomicrobiota bacterium]
MKGPLLIILPSIPWPLGSGLERRIYHLLEALGDRLPIDVFCFTEKSSGGEVAGRFTPFCRRFHVQPIQTPPWPRIIPRRLVDPLPPMALRWKRREHIRAMRSFASGHKYEGILFSELFLSPAIEEAFPKIKFRVMERSQIDWMELVEQVHSGELSWPRRLLRRDYLAKTARLERRVYQRLSGELVCGPDEKIFLRKHLGDDTRIAVLPSGFNRQYFNHTEWPRAITTKPTFLFCGALDHTANRDALGFYLRDIHPRVLAESPGATLIIVGRNAHPEVRKAAAQKGVRFVGEVKDLRPYYQSAWLQVIPRRIGGGTRMKVVESLAMRTPVVSTSCGVRGMSLVHDRDILLADRPEAIAREIIRLLKNPALRRYIEDRGLETASARYTWEEIGDQFHRILHRFFEERL